MRWLDSTTESVDMSSSKLQEIVEDRDAWCAAVPRVTKSWTWLSDWTRTVATISMYYQLVGFLGGSDGKESACNTGEASSIPGWGRSPGGGNGNPLQYSCQENPMDRGALWATVHRITKSWTWLSNWALSAKTSTNIRDSVEAFSPHPPHSHYKRRKVM